MKANKKVNPATKPINDSLEKVFAIFNNSFKLGTSPEKYDSKKQIALFDLLNIMHDLVLELHKIDPRQTAVICKGRYMNILNLCTKWFSNSAWSNTALEYLKEAYKFAGAYDLESFIIYYEWETPVDEKFFTTRMEILAGFVYYLNKMVTDPTFEGIIGNLPSGWGKTYLVDLANAFSYGYDSGGTILALCSNDDVVKGGSRTIKEIIMSKPFGEVFPNLRYEDGDKTFFKKDTESEWRLKTCKLSASYYAKTTQSNVVGCRASKWVWIDDLYADYKEALNESDNEYYYNKFLTVWRKRFVQEAKVWKFIITGTMWSPTDFIVKTINWLEHRYTFVPHKVFKYTKISLDGKFAIIQVPALNIETNKSNCEALAPTSTLLNEKNSLDSYIFECNFQQNPVSPSALAFDWKNLLLYDEPITYEATYAVIDGTRKSGKDFFSMPIFAPYLEKYALVDCIFTQKATSQLIDKIVDKIIENNIKILVIESNVDGGLKRTLKEKLKDRGFDNGITMIEKYSTMVKTTRIEMERGNIIEKIYYPHPKLFALNSDMGKFMLSHTRYNIEGNNTHDDACFDGDTLIATQFGNKKIKDIKIGDKVITPAGLRKVTNCGITGYKETINKFGLDVTPNHKTYNKIANCFMPISEINRENEFSKLKLGELIKWKQKLLSLMGKSIKETQRADIILSTQLTTKAKSKTIISTITTLAIWSVYLLNNACHNIQKNFTQQVAKQNIVQKNAKPVYNITVEGIGCYYANGILVSNCDSLAMFTMEVVAGKSKPNKPIAIQRPF